MTLQFRAGRSWLARLIAVVLVCATPAVIAAVPLKINYQGFLTDAANAPISATVQMTFRLYNVAASGSALHTETQMVTVTNGEFSAILGTSPALALPFDTQYYIGVAVGADPEMSPRQPLVASPYAIRAATAEALAGGASVPTTQLSGTIATAQIADGAVTAAKLASSGCTANQVLKWSGSAWQCAADANAGGTVTSVAAGTGLTGGTITTTGTIGLATTQLLPTVACASGQVAKWNGSAWTCAADANSGGTVTSVAATAGGGLATSPVGGVTTTGTIGIAPGGVATAMIADGAVTSAKLATAQQLPNCTDGQAIRRSGSAWVCYTLPPVTNSPIFLGSGALSKLVMPADGIPVIGLIDSLGLYRTARCANDSCAGGVAVGSVVDTAAQEMAFTLGSDGLPLFAYNVSGTASSLAKCNDILCNSTSIVTLNPIGQAQTFHSIAVGSDGFPVIAFRGTGGGSAGTIVIKCGNLTCSSQTATVVDATLNVSTAIAIGNDTFPVVAYLELNTGHLKVAKCINTACTGSSTLTIVDPNGTNGRNPSIKVPADGLPVISYWDETNNQLKVAKCGNASCSASNVLTTVDTRVGTGQYSAIAIAADGFPIVSYYDSTDQDLRIAKCGNAACNSANAVFIADSYGSVGTYPSIAIGLDGNPIIAYFDAGPQYIKTLKCSTPTCALP